jgi:hypothetical protein
MLAVANNFNIIILENNMWSRQDCQLSLCSTDFYRIELTQSLSNESPRLSVIALLN